MSFGVFFFFCALLKSLRACCHVQGASNSKKTRKRRRQIKIDVATPTVCRLSVIMAFSLLYSGIKKVMCLHFIFSEIYQTM